MIVNCWKLFTNLLSKMQMLHVLLRLKVIGYDWWDNIFIAKKQIKRKGTIHKILESLLRTYIADSNSLRINFSGLEQTQQVSGFEEIFFILYWVYYERCWTNWRY